MYLIPGDSPMGYRLPLDALPWVSKRDHPYLIEQDPMAPRGALPATRRTARRATRRAPAAGRPPRRAALSDRRTRRRPKRRAACRTRRRTATSVQARATAVGAGHAPPDRGRAAAPPQVGALGLTRTALCVEVRDPRRANGPKAEQVGRQERRAVRLHAAAGAPGGLPRPAGRPSRPPPRNWA